MNGYEVYQQYIALKSHFSENPYDYFKYNGKIKTTVEAFEKRRDKLFFEAVARKVATTNVVPFLVANMIADNDVWIGALIENYEQARNTFTDWKKKLGQLYKVYEEDLINIKEFLDEKSLDKRELFVYNGTHPLIFRFMIQGMIEKETFILLDDLLGFVPVLDKKIDDIVWKEEISRINSYRRFIHYDKSKVSSITKSILIP